MSQYTYMAQQSYVLLKNRILPVESPALFQTPFPPQMILHAGHRGMPAPEAMIMERQSTVKINFS